MKKLFSVIIFATILSGCTSKLVIDNNQSYHKNDSSIIYSSNFNEEHYIWENWSFTTNRVVQPK